MSKPFVTVLIDTYNHERFIEQAVSSALEQDFPPSEREVLVVDDGSTDNTAAVVRKFAPHVRYLGKANGGQASAFNAGIPEALGQVVSFLDGDDWWAPTKLSRVVEALGADLATGMVGHGTIHVLPDGRQFTEVLLERSRFRLDTVQGARVFRRRKSFLGTRVTIRKRILQRILPVPEAIRIEADEYVFTMAAVFGGTLILREPLLYYRIHDANFFSVDGFDERRLRLKQKCLTLLAEGLAGEFRANGVAPEVLREVIEVVRLEAKLLRLMLDGGFPWETVQAELAWYRILYERPPLAHRLFKRLTLLPAFFLPPRLYYQVRRRLVSHGLYLRAREVFLPIPQPEHTLRSWRGEP